MMDRTVMESSPRQRRRQNASARSSTSTAFSPSTNSSQNSWCITILLIATILIHSTPGVTAGGRAPFASIFAATRMETSMFARRSTSLLSTRGGATLASPPEDQDEGEEDAKEEDDDDDIRHHPDFAKLQSYRMRQQVLLQLRSTILSEVLVKRGVPLPSLSDVATPEGKKPPIKVDWECAESTKEHPIQCAFTYDAEPGTKLIAPIDPKNASSVILDSDWITIVALNRLRRKDVSKIEKMWHDKYAIIDSWFRADSEYSVLQHVGIKGVLLNILLDETVLTLTLTLSIFILLVAFMPLWGAMVNRFLVSGLLWSNWLKWARFIHLGLPFKLMVGEWLLNGSAKGFNKVKGKIKARLVEMECEILDRCLPLTMGVPTPDHVAEGDAEILEEEEEIIDHLVEEESDDEDDDSLSGEESDDEE